MALKARKGYNNHKQDIKLVEKSLKNCNPEEGLNCIHCINNENKRQQIIDILIIV